MKIHLDLTDKDSVKLSDSIIEDVIDVVDKNNNVERIVLYFNNDNDIYIDTNATTEFTIEPLQNDILKMTRFDINDEVGKIDYRYYNTFLGATIRFDDSCCEYEDLIHTCACECDE